MLYRYLDPLGSLSILWGPRTHRLYLDPWGIKGSRPERDDDPGTYGRKNKAVSNNFGSYFPKGPKDPNVVYVGFLY